ncbi:hypothetical protein C8J57DRAFT_1251679 [Mycena rebaudengoi]|nr:hypothetical protein C8J57DRAFT_1251679 [Mycena rebaudengoi]
MTQYIDAWNRWRFLRFFPGPTPYPHPTRTRGNYCGFTRTLATHYPSLLYTPPSSFRRNRFGTEGVGTTGWAFDWRDRKGGWRGFSDYSTVRGLGQAAEQKKIKSVRGTENGAEAAVLSVPRCIKKQSGGQMPLSTMVVVRGRLRQNLRVTEGYGAHGSTLIYIERAAGADF